MKAKQKQWQLFFLGFYGESTADIDGIWGEKSAAGTELFQRTYGLEPADGIFGTHTRNKSREVIESIQEMVSPCGVRNGMKPLIIDGLAGPATMAALKRYQEAKGLPQTGIVDDATWDTLMEENPAQGWSDETISKKETVEKDSLTTDTFWDEIKYFTREELKCKCGGRYCNGFPAEPHELLVRLAERARRHFGAPAHNVSCLRCPVWNARSGGVANSQHMYGEAMDICIDGVTADALLAFFQKQPEVRYCYKINSTNVHFDIPKGKR